MANVKTFDLVIDFENHSLTFGNLSRVAVDRYVKHYMVCPDFVNFFYEENDDKKIESSGQSTPKSYL